LLEVNARIRIPEREMDFSFARSSGPGGQNVNKVNSKAIMHWNISTSPSLPPDVRERFQLAFGNRIDREGNVVIASDKYRDQQRNIDDCKEKLADMLLQVAVAPKKRKATKPTRGAKERRIRGKKETSERKTMRKKVAW